MTLLLLLACERGDATSPSETGASETAQPEAWSELRVEPDGVVVYPGAEVRVRVTAVGPQGRVDVDAELSLDGDGALLEGALVAGQEDQVLHAAWEGLEASGTVEVRGDGGLLLRVVDLEGQPVPSARVVVDGERTVCGPDGQAALTVPDGPLTITAYGEDTDLVPTTFFAVKARDLVLPLRPSEGRAPDSLLAGVVDFSDSLPPDEGQVGVAITGRILTQHPLLLDADQLLGEKRPVDFFGLEVDVPGNVAVLGLDEGFSVPAWTGPGGVWVLSGPMDVATLLSAGDGDVGGTVEALTADPTVFRYSRVAAVAPDSHLTLSPDLPLDTEIDVELPALPDGAGLPLLVALEASLDGVVPTGLGAGSLHAAGQPQWVLAYVEDGGVGSGGARALRMAPVVGEPPQASVPGFLDFPVIHSFDGASREFSLTTDPDAIFVRVWIQAQDGTRRDLVLPAGELSAVIPYEGPDMGYGLTDWDLLSMDLDRGTWEQVLTDGLVADPSEALRATAVLQEERNGG